nr:hypothetical protein CFP56_24057 [Quercus suber]
MAAHDGGEGEKSKWCVPSLDVHTVPVLTLAEPIIHPERRTDLGATSTQMSIGVADCLRIVLEAFEQGLWGGPGFVADCIHGYAGAGTTHKRMHHTAVTGPIRTRHARLSHPNVHVLTYSLRKTNALQTCKTVAGSIPVFKHRQILVLQSPRHASDPEHYSCPGTAPPDRHPFLRMPILRCSALPFPVVYRQMSTGMYCGERLHVDAGARDIRPAGSTLLQRERDSRRYQ